MALAHPSFDCRDLCGGRTGRCVRLYRCQGAIRFCAAGHENNRARPEYDGGCYRDRLVHEVRSIVVAQHLSVCGAGLSVLDAWWLDPAVGEGVLSGCRRDPRSFRAADGAVRDRTACGKRRASKGAAVLGRAGDRRADRLRFGNDRNRGRRHSRASDPRHEIGHGSSDGRHDSGLQPDELRGRPDRRLRYWDQGPASLPPWLAAVAAGGCVGAFVGSRYLSDRCLRGSLAVLLLAWGLKLPL